MAFDESPEAVDGPSSSMSLLRRELDDADVIAQNARNRQWFWSDPTCDPVKSADACPVVDASSTTLFISTSSSSSSSAAAKSSLHSRVNSNESQEEGGIPYRRTRSALASRKDPIPPVVVPAPSLPIIPLDGRMQLYFHRAHANSRRTCHPRQIRREAKNITEVFSDEDKENLDAVPWGARLLHAGIYSQEYSRSIAAVVSEVLTELTWSSADVTHELYIALMKALITAFFFGFYQTELGYLDGSTGLEPISPVLEPMRAQLLSIAAFAGDLFALGVLPATIMCEMVSTLVYDLRSLTHCRALHLLLIRAYVSARQTLSVPMLHLWRDALVRTARGQGIFILADTMVRWIIEICNVLDWMGCDPRKASGPKKGACHRWDISLSGDVMSRLLQTEPCATHGPVPQGHPLTRRADGPPKRAAMQDITTCFVSPSDVGGGEESS